MKSTHIKLALLAVITTPAIVFGGDEASGPKFTNTVESLRQYECPDWFRDAKFGIYLHWGAYSVAEQGEWYARNLYIEGHKDYKHHLKTYGHPSEHGYVDFIPQWKAENFDPDALLALYLAHDDPDDPRSTQPYTTTATDPVLIEDFESTGTTENFTSPPYPAETWHLQDATGVKPHWSRDDQDEGQSVQIGDFNDDPDQEIRIGWGYDEVAVLYFTEHVIDPGRDYLLSGDWEIANPLNNSLGFIAGLAEFSAVDGSLVQRLTGDNNVFGVLVNPVAGQTGFFQVNLTAEALQAANVSEGNVMGIFLHHDDDGVLYSDNSAFGENRNDVYLVDNVKLLASGGTAFQNWAHANGVTGKDQDPDGDGLCNLIEFAFGGDPMSHRSLGHQPVLALSPQGMMASFPKRRDVSLAYTIESKAGLLDAAWEASNWFPEPTGVQFNAGFDTVSGVVELTAGQVFLRLLVSE